MTIKFTILGCGSSMGVPRPDGSFGKCNPSEKKNYRTRCGAIISSKYCNTLIDSSPDLRFQLLRNKIKKIDRVLYSHFHADQTHGINDLRIFFIKNKKEIPIYTEKKTKNYLLKNFNSFNVSDSLKKILMSPNNSEKSWVWEQYDQTVMGDTIQKPGGDSAVIRIHGKNKGVAITVDSSTHYSLASPIDGGKQVVCETWRNLISVGSNPIAITNCLNFGNPEKNKIMGQFVESIDGISQACTYLDFPVVSGNVSFYNETKNKPISPTPVIGGVGLIKNLDDMMTLTLTMLMLMLMLMMKIGRASCRERV